MFLKNEKYLNNFFILFSTILLFCTQSNADDKKKVLQHINKLKHFSASFIQNDGVSLSEGKVYIGENRVRAEYFSPSKILIILDEDKAMYYNYDLEEDEFFNPKNTNAWFLYDIFRNPSFFENGVLRLEKNELIIEKSGVDNEQRDYLLRVYFESDPIIFRAIEFFINDEYFKLSIFNHNYNEEFDRDFFKLINPNFLN